MAVLEYLSSNCDFLRLTIKLIFTQLTVSLNRMEMAG